MGVALSALVCFPGLVLLLVSVFVVVVESLVVELIVVVLPGFNVVDVVGVGASVESEKFRSRSNITTCRYFVAILI